MTPEVRLSPDGTLIAVKHDYGWTVNYAAIGARFNGEDVSGWTPLLPASNEDRVDCPWCGKPGRKLTASGSIRRHGKPVWPPQDCEGSGRKPAEFRGDAA